LRVFEKKRESGKERYVEDINRREISPSPNISDESILQVDSNLLV